MELKGSIKLRCLLQKLISVTLKACEVKASALELHCNAILCEASCFTNDCSLFTMSNSRVSARVSEAVWYTEVQAACVCQIEGSPPSGTLSVERAGCRLTAALDEPTSNRAILVTQG